MGGQNGKENEITPSLFDGLEAEKPEEETLEYAVVQSLPVWKKEGKTTEWQCRVYCPPDIFNQDRNASYVLHARTYAAEAKKQRLRPGDVATVRGIAYTQEVETLKGKTTVNHVTVSEITVVSRAKRVSLTVYEMKRGK